MFQNVFELVYDYQFKSSRYSYGSIYLNSRVTTNQKHSIDSQKTKRKELKHVIIQKKTIKSEKEKRKEEKTLEEQIHSQIFLLFSKQSYNVIFYAGIRGWEHAMNYSFHRQRKNWVEWRMQSEKAGVGDGPLMLPLHFCLGLCVSRCPLYGH